MNNGLLHSFSEKLPEPGQRILVWAIGAKDPHSATWFSKTLQGDSPPQGCVMTSAGYPVLDLATTYDCWCAVPPRVDRIIKEHV